MDPLQDNPKQKMPKDSNLKSIVIAVAFTAVATGVLGGYVLFSLKNMDSPVLKTIIDKLKPDGGLTNEPIVSVSPEDLKFVKFGSVDEFKEYLEVSADLAGGYYGVTGGTVMRNMAMDEAQAVPMAMEAGLKTISDSATPAGWGVSEEAGRVSETNVQVTGIDEPDILKTDGSQIFYSGTQRYYYKGIEPMPMIDIEMGVDSVAPNQPKYFEPTTKVVKAFPPSQLSEIAGIEKTGNLLLIDNTLVVFSNDQKIYGFDVANPEKPAQNWEIEFDNRSYLIQARLYDNKIFMITSQGVDYSRPCPFEPLKVNGIAVAISCTDVYHPITPAPADVTYVAMVIDPKTGAIENKTSFVGSSYGSIIYMSPEAIYATYNIEPDFVKFMYNFLTAEARDLIPENILARLQKLNTYDISNNAKMIELEAIMNQWQQSLTDNERLRVENEMTNRMDTYIEDHIRELGQTGIAKIGLKDFKVQATGAVPGRLLNQFSMDEYNGNLRVATTIDGGMFGSSENVSDVYVLDNNLKQLSSVRNLGETERIYSVRFINDRGYVVTFRQVDPFYVIDLSNPKKAELKGELKIPGYSSYLHPISENIILGVGKEDSKVKLSMFDVSDASNPKEAAKYTLEEYWSEVLNTHHAFLLDDKHEVFFMPGSRGGYIFSYADNKLRLEAVVTDIFAQRALYLDDYMYIVGDDKIIVLNENDWQPVNELEFEK